MVAIRHFNPLPPHGGRLDHIRKRKKLELISIHSLRMEGDSVKLFRQRNLWNFNPLPPHGGRHVPLKKAPVGCAFQSTPSAWRETSGRNCGRNSKTYFNPLPPHGGRRCSPLHSDRRLHISIHSLRMEGDSKTAQESVFHFAYPCTILQKRMQKTTFCTRKNGFFRKKGEKFGAKPSASFCAPMIRTDTFPLNFSHRISGSSMSMVSFAPICSTFD